MCTIRDLANPWATCLLTIFRNVRVFSPDPLGVCQVLVGGSKILAVSTEEIDIAGASVIDGLGRRLLPGFIDGHAHLTGGGGEAGFKTRVPAPLLGHYTQVGVTTVVGVLGTDDTTRDTRSLVAQTYALREQGLGAYCHTGGYHLPPMTLTGSVRDDIVFIDPVIGVGEIAISDHRSSQPTLDEILRLASEVHVAGLITGKAGILHLHLGDGERGLELVRDALAKSELPARVFNPTHVNRRKALFDEAMDLAAAGATVDVTAYPVGEEEDAWQADEAVIYYLDAGAPGDRITVSSDGGGCLPVFDEQGVMTAMEVGQSSALLVTLTSLLAKGVPLEIVLPMFTSNVANLLRLSGRGRILPGYRADLIMLDDSDDLQDVMISGRWHRRDGRQIIAGQFENT